MLTRRAILFAATAAALRADAADDAWDTIASAARTLSDAGSAIPFLSFFDPKMTGYETLRTNVPALMNQFSLQSTLELQENDGSNTARDVEVDWELRMADLGDGLSVKRRQERVKCRVEKQGKKWRITSFVPLSLFAP